MPAKNSRHLTAALLLAAGLLASACELDFALQCPCQTPADCPTAGAACVDGWCKACPLPCGAGEVCQEGECRATGCGDRTCSAGEACVQDECVACAAAETICVGGNDEDCDGSSDCADADCAEDGACVAPGNLERPVIQGTPTDGATLTASRGTWSGAPTISYAFQWQRCDGAGANCADLANATAATLLLVPADVGSRLQVRVSAVNGFGQATATSAPTAVVAAAIPSSASPPVVSGAAVEGTTLTVTSVGNWVGTPIIYCSYQWQRCDAAGAGCVEIPGADNAHYQLTAADVGSRVRVVVTATNDAGGSSVNGELSAVVVAARPVNVALPEVSGTASEGATLSASSGTWTGAAPISYAYQWQRCDAAGANCVEIAGAVDATCLLAAADVGFRVRVIVTASNTGYSVAAASAPTAVVTAG